jgi:hypothetical protein
MICLHPYIDGLLGYGIGICLRMFLRLKNNRLQSYLSQADLARFDRTGFG